MYILSKCDSVCVCVCICSQAIAACMATFLVDVLTAGNRLNAKVSSAVEKVQPFTRPDILQKKGKSKKKVQPVHVWTLANCNLYNEIYQSMEVHVNGVVHNKAIFTLYFYGYKISVPDYYFVCVE